MNITTRQVVLTAMFTAMVTLLTFINIPLFGPQGGLIHLGYVALFPIAILYGRYVGMIAGGIGMALFDVLSGWAAWAPGTFLIVGAIGYVVGLFAAHTSNLGVIVAAMILGSLISIGGYFLYNAYIMGFGVPSAVTSMGGDALKVFGSTAITLATLPVLRRLKAQFEF